MAAITVADIVAGLKLRPEGMKMKFRSKNDESVKYKCLVKSVDKKEGKASIEALEGPSEGKTLNVTLERLLRMQGRQVGASPASSKKVETAKPAAKVKETAKPAAKPAAKSGKVKTAKKADAEELNLKSAKSELLDIAELLRDLAIRSETLLNFLEGYQDNEEETEEEEEEDADESEEEEEEESPAPKPKKKSRKPAMDEED